MKNLKEIKEAVEEIIKSTEITGVKVDMEAILKGASVEKLKDSAKDLVESMETEDDIEKLLEKGSEIFDSLFGEDYKAVSKAVCSLKKKLSELSCFNVKTYVGEDELVVVDSYTILIDGLRSDFKRSVHDEYFCIKEERVTSFNSCGH